MATHPIGGTAAPVTLPGLLPPMPAVARVLSQFDRNKLGAAIEVMIALLDLADPDPDAEGSAWPEDVRAVVHNHMPEDSEEAGDEADAAWIEWHTLRPWQRRWPNQTADQEDDESAGDDQDGDWAEDEPCALFSARNGPGCPVSDPPEYEDE